MRARSARATIHIATSLVVACCVSQTARAATASPAEAPPRAATVAEHQARCAGKDGWSDPAPPIRLFGNIYDIGTCGITVLLVAGDKGAIVLDGATAEAAPSIIANIRRLGYKPTDIKLLLSTHEHRDHAAGLQPLQAWTGATMVAMAASRAALESGVAAADDPQRENGTPAFRGVRVGRVVRDGDAVRLGSLILTAHATPGHAPGGTSWSWRSCQGKTCHAVVYADSVSAIAAQGYRFSDHPAYVAAFRASLARIAGLPCDLIITPHPAASDLYQRLAGKSPLSAPTACTSYAAAGRVRLDRRLADEGGAATAP